MLCKLSCVYSYLHWSIPKLYRQAIATSGLDDASAKAQLALKGFPNVSSNPGEATFRPLPNRWVVFRSIRKPKGLDTVHVRRDLSEESGFPDSSFNAVAGDLIIQDCFVIEGVRMSSLLSPSTLQLSFSQFASTTCG